jgi:hypothetical protein
MPVERLINIHRHLWDTDWFPPDHRRNFARRAAARTHPPRDVEEILPRVGQGVYDPDGPQMLADMETLGIGTSVIMVGPMNIWLDICDWQLLGAIEDRNIAEFFRVLGHMRPEVGAHRILWGTDLPMRGSGFQLTKRWAEIMQNLPEEAATHGVTFTQEEAEFIAHGNAERLLGI